MNRPPVSAPLAATAPRSAGGQPASPWRARRDALSARWAALGSRERTWIAAVAAVVAALLLWSVGIQPAWRTLQDAPARIDNQGAQLQAMQRLAAEATELRAVAPVPTAQAAAALQGATEQLGGRATLLLQGDRATVTLNGLAGEELRDWLAEVRSAARARPTEVQLSRGAQGYTGTVVLSLGGAR